jgi:hypothetical protein
MSDEPKKDAIKEYAGGWITEREGMPIPGFLKLAFPIIGLFCCGYLIVYMNGEVNHSDRGSLVQTFNRSTGTADLLMWSVFGLMLIYVVIAVTFALRKSDH